MKEHETIRTTQYVFRSNLERYKRSFLFDLFGNDLIWNQYGLYKVGEHTHIRSEPMGDFLGCDENELYIRIKGYKQWSYIGL